MSDKRIIQLTETQTIAADDYVPVDGATGGTKKFLASNLGGKAEVMTGAEWDDLPDSKLTDGKVYALSGVSPSTQDNPLWQKLGFAALDTTADDCSDAINELNTGLTTLNSNLFNNTIHEVTSSDSTKITVGDGGYWQIGKLVIVNVRLTISSTISGSGVSLVSALPKPKTNNGLNTITFTLFGASTVYNIYLNTGTGTTSDIRTNTNLSAGTYVISGCYVAA